MIYLFMTLLSVILAVIYKEYDDRYSLKRREGDFRKSRTAAVLSVLPFIAVAGFRYDVGTDYLYTYVPNFKEIANGQDSYFEWGFYLLNKVIQLYTLDYFWLFLVCAAITYIMVFDCIYRYLKDPAFGIFLFVATTSFFVSLNTTRQYMAIAFFLWALRYIKRKELGKYVVAILLGSLFHYSILIMLPLYFLCRIRYRPVAGFVIVGLSYAVTSLLRVILTGFFAQRRYGAYFDSSYDSHETAVRFLLINAAVLLFGTLCAGSSAGKSADDDETMNIYMQIQLASTVVCACSGALPLAYRIIWNFSSIQILLIPEALNRIESDGWRRFWKAAVILSFGLLTVVTVFILGEHQVIPYRTVFEK